MKIVRQDAWTCTLELIERLSSGAAMRAAPCTPTRTVTCNAARMEFVERLSPTIVTFNWRDATSGCYGEQLWHLTTARARASCMLSGAPIRRGSAVYRPRLRGRRAANADWIVLAATIDRIEGESSGSID
ncbi:DUF3331 domain-containing protein [Paraburkholderia sp. CNPSo 3274]|uniref:DUF3331 domain-containing protein n=1 Tax=Paraburkholderia sp. CNPSo 3274 TaxID=2940932 RepID=UPI0020B81A39|nr:DUF3331 domain-containing protein [Paraburkholderia sp. CNPSo 3274]MCP3708697.1 DUF3331 domain-containing protein [Paraburkholderia sp. CNPSo 3274]